jgi:integrase
MRQRHLNRLTIKTVATKKKAGLYADGGGLYLQVAPAGTKSWVFRYLSPLTRKPRYMGLGALHSVGLQDARTAAEMQRGLMARGIDPIPARNEERARNAAEAAMSVTFAKCATAYIKAHKAGWRNDKHADQWTNTIETYANPVIGALPIQSVDTALVLKILEPIWSKKPETANRLRGRIESVLDWAKARGYRRGENPARWRGHLDQLLPALAKKARVKHHTAMPFTEVGAFVARLRVRAGTTPRCLEFTILTAARTGEAIQAKPEEFDLEKATWTIPASRMKAQKEHRVPLSPRAVEIAREAIKQGGEYLFPRHGNPLSNAAMLALLRRMKVDVTVHGFRSSFRDWAAE